MGNFVAEQKGGSGAWSSVGDVGSITACLGLPGFVDRALGHPLIIVEGFAQAGLGHHPSLSYWLVGERRCGQSPDQGGSGSRQKCGLKGCGAVRVSSELIKPDTTNRPGAAPLTLATLFPSNYNASAKLNSLTTALSAESSSNR